MTQLPLLSQGSFHYMEHPLNHSAGIPFKYNDPLDIIIKPGQRGFLVLWNQTSLLVSPNSGEPHPVQASTNGDGFRLGTQIFVYVPVHMEPRGVHQLLNSFLFYFFLYFKKNI